MPSLAQTLSSTTPVSVLLRKARRLGVCGGESLIALAVARGCLHYASNRELKCPPPDRSALSDEELTILLLVGENAYEPTAIRCAAQLARSPHIDPERLARLARMEKTERVLSHIARAGLAHDPAGTAFWRKLLQLLPAQPSRSEPDLPHWTRFVSMPGRQRGREIPPTWLVPIP